MTTVYSDIGTSTGAFEPGTGSSAPGTGVTSQLVADDITPAAGDAGQTVTSGTFSFYNANPEAVTFVAQIRFYAADGAAGGSTTTVDGPGTILYGVNSLPITVSGGTGMLEQFSLPTTGTPFILPAGTFWAGVSFGNGNGSTGVTADELSNLGQATFDPPTVGTSTDNFFQSDDGGSFLTANPGGAIYDFGGSPAANFGWQFAVTSAVPEPTSLAVLAVAGVAALGRRRRTAR